MTIKWLVSLMATCMVLGVGWHAWRRGSPGLACLAGWCASLAAAAWLATLGIAPDGSRSAANLAGMALLNTLAGTALVAYVYDAIHGRLPSPWVAVPVGLHLLALGVLGTAVNDWYPLRHSIFVEWAFSAVALGLYIGAWRARGSRRPPRPVVGGVLLMIVALHAGQATQMLVGFGTWWLVDNLLFLVVGLWMSSLLALAFAETTLFLRPDLEAEAAPSAEDEALFARLEVVMRDARPWTDPDFELATLASAVRSHPNAVSRALTRAGGTTFYDYLNAFRVREAERLLLDPSEARYKVEALGRQAGFKARSTFFKAFRAYTGLTPAEFRRQRLPTAPDERRQAS